MTHTALAQTLRDRANEIPALPVVTGFDGFVDEMITVVHERSSTIRLSQETLGL